MAGEWSEGHNAPWRGGWIWAREIRTSGLLLRLGERGAHAMRMLSDWVGGDSPEFVMTNATAKELLRCPDQNPRRCRRWTEGRDELLALGLLERTGNRSEYRAVMPSARTQRDTKRVPTGTQSVPSGTQNVSHTVQLVSDTVQKVSHTVRAYKEVDNERREGEKTHSACVREAADRCFAKYPANRRTNPANFARLFEVAVQAWGVRYDVDRDTAIGQVEARTLWHLDAHRQARREDRYFPAPQRFFGEHIDNEPDQPELSPEAARRQALKGLTW